MCNHDTQFHIGRISGTQRQSLNTQHTRAHAHDWTCNCWTCADYRYDYLESFNVGAYIDTPARPQQDAHVCELIAHLLERVYP